MRLPVLVDQSGGHSVLTAKLNCCWSTSKKKTSVSKALPESAVLTHCWVPVARSKP